MKTLRSLLKLVVYILPTITSLHAANIMPEIDANADSVRYVGNNIIAKGNAIIYYGKFRVEADNAVINMKTKDLEATGNVTATELETTITEAEQYQIERAEKRDDVLIKNLGVTTRPNGRQMQKIEIKRPRFTWHGAKFIGNMETGYYEMDKFTASTPDAYIVAERAVRAPTGVIEAETVIFSTCEYLKDGHEHYAFHCKKLTMTPDNTINIEANGLNSEDTDSYFYETESVVGKIGAVPIFWLPGLSIDPPKTYQYATVTYGDTAEHGSYLWLTKRISIPGLTIKPRLYLDYYSKRGIGYGVSAKSTKQNSDTEFLAYGIRDDAPYASVSDNEDDDKAAKDRLDIPKNRYMMRFRHYSHLTPRLDFRTNIAVLSDYRFQNDYFQDLDDRNPQPATFAELDYQFDSAGANLTARPRVNDFFSVVERLPELSVAFHRQQLSDEIYYEGKTTLSNLEMKWREYDDPRTLGNLVDPTDYDTVRFDSLHMLYMNKQIGGWNFIPRAGVRLTAYSDSSKGEVSQQQLRAMAIVDNPYNSSAANVTNYDDEGGSLARFTGEIGLEINKKYYKSWQNVKNAYWELDGIRHVSVPYVNYNWTLDPSEDRDHIYYFDDVDRIREDHFVRLGWKNRLQTRRGSYNNQRIQNWLTMENYYDYFINDYEDYEHTGNFGSVISFTPNDKLSMTLNSIIDPDAGGNNLKYTSVSTSYKFTDQWKWTTGYTHIDDYDQRGISSMGSSMTRILSGSWQDRQFSNSHTINNQLNFPITDTMYGELVLNYDLNRDQFAEKSLGVVKKLHCWELLVNVAEDYSSDSTGKEDSSLEFSFSLRLATDPSNVLEPYGGATQFSDEVQDNRMF